jgi:hypothetical protein
MHLNYDFGFGGEEIPTVEQLTLTIDRRWAKLNFHRLLTSLYQRFPNVKQFKLNFDGNCVFEAPVGFRSQNSPWPLHSLHLDTGDADFGMELIESLLHSTTELRELTWDNPCTISSLFLHYYGPQVKRLNLRSFIDGDYEDMMKGLPSLEILDVETFGTFWLHGDVVSKNLTHMRIVADSLPGTYSPVLTLTKLEFLVQFHMADNVVSSIVDHFPNLMELSMSHIELGQVACDDELKLLGNLKKLEKFTLCNFRGISGEFLKNGFPSLKKLHFRCCSDLSSLQLKNFKACRKFKGPNCRITLCMFRQSNFLAVDVP